MTKRIQFEFLDDLKSDNRMSFKMQMMQSKAIKQVCDIAVYTDNALKDFKFEVRKGKTIKCIEVVSDNTHYSSQVSRS